ncbi:tape measure protein [Chryseobacterium indologenes]|uniref:tape measure protein n=1 Tax=Chryseobacterium TaxID=59732 RepID=UPI00162A562E|nr:MULTISPECIES: tape measure protein [Chryseobacterium]MDM1557057.1 tape measure protein [Chryseobacterium indologenes]
MSNIVEFVVRMKDLMSGGLSRMSSASRSAFTQMAQHADRVTGRNRVLGQSYNELQRQIRAVQSTISNSTIPSQIQQARRELERLQRLASRHPGSSAGRGGSSGGGSGGGSGIGGIMTGNMLADVGMNIASAFLNAVKAGIGGAISGSMQKEKDITGLSTFIGDKAAQENYMKIRHDAEISSYDTGTLLKANRALVSVDGNAEAAREDIMNLANAISATGGGTDELQRMAINMQQIKSLGKASAADIKQFGYAGINIYGLLAKATGKSTEEVKNMDVTYDLLAKSLAMARSEGGIYEGALEKMNKTMAGKWESVKDRSQNALTDIGDAFAPVIHKVLDVAIQMSQMVQPMLAMAAPYIDMISNGLGVAIDYIMNIGTGTSVWGAFLNTLVETYGVLWNTLKTIFSTVWKIISGIIEWGSKSELMRDIFKAVNFVLVSILEVTGALGKLLGWVWDHVLLPFLETLEMVYKIIKGILGFGKENKIAIDVTQSVALMPKPKKEETEPYKANLTRFKNVGVPEDKDKAKNKKESKKAGDTIAGGGTKYITINLGKFFDNIQFTTVNMKESEQEIEKILMELMGRVLYNGGKNM